MHHQPSRLPHLLIDTHLHSLIMLERLNYDVPNLLESFREINLGGALDVAVDEQNFPKRVEIAKKGFNLKLSVGIHPLSTSEDYGSETERLDEIIRQANHPFVVAIGECGIDLYRDCEGLKRQQKFFDAQLSLSAKMNYPIIVHNRCADQHIVDAIKNSSCRLGVLHCFSSDWNMAQKAMDMGFFLSFAGNLTYKKNDLLRDVATRIPSDKLLIETDSPFLAPQPARGTTNHPGYMDYTLETLASIRKESKERLAEILYQNANRLFGSFSEEST